MKHIAWIFACLVCAAAQAADKVRTWTDVQGRTMEAEFLREVDGDVAFLKDGKLITIPLDRLSEADRKTIRELEAGRVVPEEARPAGAPPATSDPAVRAPAPPAADTRTPAPQTGSKDASPVNRVWTDTSSNKFTATFVRVQERDIELLRGGRTMTIAFDSLSAEDQAYIRELLTARGEERLIPAVVSNHQNAQPASAAADDSPPQAAAPSDARSADQVQPVAPRPEPESRGTRRRRLKFENSQQIVQYLIGMPILAAISSLIGAVILRAAAYWVLGGHLAYGDAYGTVFLANISYGVLAFLLTIVGSNLSDDTAQLFLMATPLVGFVVLSGIIAARHEIGFGEACLVSLVMILTWVVVLVIVVVLGAGVLMGLRPAS